MPSAAASWPIDEPRRLKVIYIGAGVSGIVAAIEFMKAVPSLELLIYEKNSEVGGTWYENRYPGCACDIPSHAYQLSFESWTDWSEFYAGSPEILEYWKRVTDKYGIRKYIRFQHKCVEARWDDLRCKWIVKVLKIDEDKPQIIEEEADIFITGTGLLNEWKWPDIRGLHDFKGRLLHTANWDNGFNATDKRVAVIGAGSSGIQVVPALVNKVKAIDHYVRGKTWISSQLSEDILKQNATAGSTNFRYTEEQKKAWKADPDTYLKYRKSLESRLQGNYEISQRESLRHQNARSTYEANMRERLASRLDVLNILIPDFPPLCKRLTPGPGYLEALVAEHVSVIPQAITHINETGIVTADGIHRPVDAIVCATGFQTTPGSGFPIYGQDAINLRDKQAVRPKTYLGLCTNNFPNFFQSLGPNSFQGTGSLLIMIEHVHRYIAKVLQRMVYGHVKSIQPKRKQVENFTNYCEEYFKKTVFTAECVSWYKTVEPGTRSGEPKRERVTALWPGSSLHALRVLTDVRWDDFEIEHIDENDFAWFGDGSTLADNGVFDNAEGLSWYLNGPQFLHEPLDRSHSSKAVRKETIRSEAPAELMSTTQDDSADGDTNIPNTPLFYEADKGMIEIADHKQQEEISTLDDIGGTSDTVKIIGA